MGASRDSLYEFEVGFWKNIYYLLFIIFYLLSKIIDIC